MRESEGLPERREPNRKAPAVRTTGVGPSPGGSDARTDEALVAAMALDDEAAAVAFVRRYQRRVFGMAIAVVSDPGLAEDVAQEALLRVWRHAPVYDVRRGSVATWVLTITRNLAIDALRLRRAVPIEPDDVLALGLVSSEADPQASAERADAAGRARAALQAIPPEQRRALMLSAYYGLTAEEIATRDGIPLGTAKTRIRAALQKVRAALETSPEAVQRWAGERT